MFHRHHQEAPQTTPGPHRYLMREKLLALRDNYHIENEHRQRVFHVDGKLLRLRDTLLFKDIQGHELLKIQEKWLRGRHTMNIYRGHEVAASVHEAFVEVARDRYQIRIPLIMRKMVVLNFLYAPVAASVPFLRRKALERFPMR
jgi:uncharacterized protein YxjI